MVRVSVSGEKQRHSCDDNAVSHFTNSSPLCMSVILMMCFHVVDFMCFLDYLHVDYPLVFFILFGNSDSQVDTQAVRDTFDIGKNLLAAVVFTHRSAYGVFLSLCYCLFFLKNLYQKCFNTIGPALNMCLD